ncbi:MAG: TIGR02757 family protein [Muribaculaceae bacterium]|nr:TIGR02757 family protein [Muribaculaceae bacterium]
MDLKELLDSEAKRINNRGFIDSDPVQFPRRFDRLQDIEIAALLSATIAWGNRKMICRNCDRMLEMMGNDPYNFVMDGAWREIDPDQNIHRTFFGRNLRHYLRGLEHLYRQYGSIREMMVKTGIDKEEAPSWVLTRRLADMLTEANEGATDSRCLPGAIETSALKRINMATRWMVRDDGIVDLGVWDNIKPSQLYIPLDVHVGRTARSLGLLERKSNDRKAVIELTGNLKALRPEDPVLYDYALFGIGMNL